MVPEETKSGQLMMMMRIVAYKRSNESTVFDIRRCTTGGMTSWIVQTFIEKIGYYFLLSENNYLFAFSYTLQNHQSSGGGK